MTARPALVLSLLLAAGVAAAQPGRLEPGDAQLDSGEYYDVHFHDGRAGERLTVSIVSTEFDPYLIVLGPGGEELLQEDDSPGQGLNVRVDLELPGDGAYTVAVTSALPGETGAYTLTVSSAPTPGAPGGPGAPPPDTSNPLVPATPATPEPLEPDPANPLSPRAASLSGTWSDGSLTVELQETGGVVRGRLSFGGRDYEVDASGSGGAVEGTFAADGQRHAFSATLEGEVLTLESGGARYELRRSGDAPARPAPGGEPAEPAPGGEPAEPAPAGEPAGPGPDADPPTREPVLPPQEPTPPAGEPTPAPPVPTPVPADPLDAARFFFIPSDEEGAHNVAKPRIETDAAGTVHIAVPGHAGGDAYYLTCPADCRDPSQLSTVTLQTDGTAYNAMIALDAGGVPRVLIGAYQAVYYATCTGDCRTQEAWTVTRIVQHDPNDDREVTGEAFALDPQGRPRFVMHAYRAFLGVGQPTPVTLYVACDADCHAPANWRQSPMSEQIWQESTLRFGADGRAHLATVASAEPGDIGGYMTCAVDCESGVDAWTGLGLTFAFSDRNVERIDPAITLALTREGRPRVMLLGRDESGARDLSYWSCDAADCSVEAGWTANYLIGSEDLGAGLDLTLDPQDRPRAVYNADDNVFLLVCDGDCLQDDEEGWTLLPVELANEIPVDEVIPYFNCNIAAWLLRYPSLALGPDGLPRVAYVAEDISGVLGRQDPLHAECTPGVDMAIGRFARLASLEPPP